MGIWDNVKDRLGLGGGHGNAGRGYEGYRYPEYEDEDADYDSSYEEENGDYVEQPAAMRRFGVDRADYYNDNHSPLVSQTDVRSQQLSVSPAIAQPRDRIPAPQPYRRGTNLPTLGADDNELAFKDGLARTSSSLSQLQIERLRMENTGKMNPSEDDSSPERYRQPQTRITDRSNTVIEASERFGQNQVRQSVHRRIEQISPVSYADAEQLTQALKRGAIILLDLRTTRPDLAKRILDFSFGAASALDGAVERYIDRVYIFSCNDPLTAEEKASIYI